MLRAPPQKRSQAGTQTYQERRADNAYRQLIMPLIINAHLEEQKGQEFFSRGSLVARETDER
jgi:hypothetical protein